jgi:hypothetical protein
MRGFCQNAQLIGTSQFTETFYTPEHWSQLIDVEASKKQGKIRLKYEREARALLEAPVQPPLFKTVGEALRALQLMPDERALIPTPDDAPGMAVDGIVGLAEVSYRRMKVTTCKTEIRENQTVMEVSAISKTEQQFKIPAKRILKPDEVFFTIQPHELGTHLRTAINGGYQGCELLREGTSDYLETQEGLSILSEMIQGEYFGHPRQREFAARYLAVAMALRGELYQNIFQELADYHLDPKVIGKTIWRVVRGTSLTHQDVSIPVIDGDAQMILPGAECFPKDYVYFSGMMKLIEWFRNSIPVNENMVTKGSVGLVDFSDKKTIARIGYAHPLRQTVIPHLDPKSYQSMKTHYDVLSALGKDALIQLLDYLSVGKMTFEEMTNGDSAWKPYLDRTKIIGIKTLYTPV